MPCAEYTVSISQKPYFALFFASSGIFLNGTFIGVSGADTGLTGVFFPVPPAWQVDVTQGQENTLVYVVVDGFKTESCLKIQIVVFYIVKYGLRAVLFFYYLLFNVVRKFQVISNFQWYTFIQFVFVIFILRSIGTVFFVWLEV